MNLTQASLPEVRAMTRAALVEARNSDGGWAYRRGARSRLEPTCWALLALAQADGGEVDIQALRRWPLHDGWLIDIAGVPPNIGFNAVATLTLLQASAGRAMAQPLVTRLLDAKGQTYRNSASVRQDNTLAAWSWIDGTISWVEPTAWSLLALKQQRKRGGPSSVLNDRIDIAERMLIDRACPVGGWNYGNAHVYDSDLLPHVPTTALGLLAMQDHRTHPVIQRSLGRLQQDATSERSPLALSLSSICLRVYGVPAAAVDQQLLTLSAERRRVRDENENHHGLAMALYALSTIDRAATAFTL
jgi:hypothetical protein